MVFQRGKHRAGDGAGRVGRVKAPGVHLVRSRMDYRGEDGNQPIGRYVDRKAPLAWEVAISMRGAPVRWVLGLVRTGLEWA